MSLLLNLWLMHAYAQGDSHGLNDDLVLFDQAHR